MDIPTTGIIFTFGTFIYFFLSWRFQRYHKLEENYIARIFSFSFMFLGLGNLIVAVPCLFLNNDVSLWRIIAPLQLVFISMGYLLILYNVLWSKIKEYAVYIVAFILVIVIYGMFLQITHPSVYFFTDGVLNWKPNPVMQIFSPALLLFAVPSILFFFYEAKRTTDKRTRTRAFGLGLMVTWMIVTALMDLFLLTVLKVHPIYSDLNYLLMYLIIVITLILTWGPPRSKWATKVE